MCFSTPAILHAEILIEGLGAPFASDDDEVGSIEGPRGGELARLERHLRRTAVIVRKRGLTPTGEHDVQKVMHAYLDDNYDTFTTDVGLPKPIKGFKPDGGIPELRAAIEFKFVDGETELKTAFSGIVEDLSGYAGSKDWTRFFSVVYMTAPYETEGRFDAGLKATGNAARWTTILVTGPGGRPKKAKKTAE